MGHPTSLGVLVFLYWQFANSPQNCYDEILQNLKYFSGFLTTEESLELEINPIIQMEDIMLKKVIVFLVGVSLFVVDTLWLTGQFGPSRFVAGIMFVLNIVAILFFIEMIKIIIGHVYDQDISQKIKVVEGVSLSGDESSEVLKELLRGENDSTFGM